MPSKRSHGEGTLRHRSDGRWELRMMDGYQKDGSPRFKTFYGKTQKEVKLKLKEYQDALISGVQLDTILYFEDWADTWFEGHKDNIAPTTQESYKYCLKMLKEGFYHRPLTVIRPIDIENFLKGMRRNGRSDSYISKARGMLYQIFQKAEANDLVRRNPVRLAEKMRATGTAKRKEAFTTAEVAHLMKVLPDDRMGLSIRLLLGTGMRMQELLALEPQYIEEDGSVIHIRQAVKVVKGTVSIGSPVFQMGQENPVKIAKAAIRHAQQHGNDMVFLDTAGRLHVDEALMNELKSIKAEVQPNEILLVVDAMTGQDAVNAAQSFNEWLDIDGVMLTKLDGDARGGAALSVKAVTGKPIKFIGTGEKLDMIEPFHPERMASRILGMGDVLTLIEKAEQALDQKKAAELEQKMRANKFTLADFYDQLLQIRKMGPMQDLLGMIPGMGSMKNVQVDESALGRVEAIILSMTPYERENPACLNSSRKRRIALGCGQKVEDVNRLLKQFDQMQQLMKQMNGKGKKRKLPGKMGGFPGFPGM